jgi:DNA helicase-2/ATP-dependent DNA helicase PcrA
MTAAYLAKLNTEQRRAVEHGCGALDGASPLLIIAGAGSGKTNTLANRVAHLIVSGADPRRMMLLTFSRRAAGEMQRRVERITAEVLGAKAGPMAHALNWSGTFHAIGARLLREYALDIGLSNTFTIHDREDSADLMNLVRHDLGFSKTDKRFPMKGTCLSIYSRVVNAEAPLGEVLGSYFPWCAEWEIELQKLFGAYVEAKQKQNVLDYDDLLLYWVQMMVEGAVAQDVADRFDHVLVDEYQDTNRLQASILLALKPNGRGLTVVGDDAQSIYSFRAATVRNILDFPGHFSPKAEIITLERNYRSTQPILAAANAVIDLASERFTKNLWSDRASAERPSAPSCIAARRSILNASGCSMCFPSCASEPGRQRVRCPEGSSRCWPLPARSWNVRLFCCLTSHRSAWHRRSWRRFLGLSGKSAAAARPCFWSSKMPRSRSMSLSTDLSWNSAK